MSDYTQAKKLLEENLDEHKKLLREAYRASLVSVEYFQDWISGIFKDLGMEAEEFHVKGTEVKEQPAFHATYADPDSIGEGPKNVLGYLNKDATDGILLYAHADKRPETYEWGKDTPDIVEEDGRLYGAGIADDVSGLAAMLSAVKLFRDLGYTAEKKVMIASILGKQGGVFGTYGLMRRYGPMKAAIYMHPAESGAGLKELKVASNGLIEFDIRVTGKRPDSTEVHQTIFSKSAVSALDKLMEVYGKLRKWAERQSEKYFHEAVHALAGQSFALTAGKFSCGEMNELFEIPLEGYMKGTISFPPRADLDTVKREFEEELERIGKSDSWLSQGKLSYSYGDRVGDSAESNLDCSFIKDSVEVVKAFGKEPEFFYGHSMSDIRYPLLDWKADAAYGIGPLAGDLGTEKEWIDKEEYFLSIAVLAELIKKAAG
jgi:acetylornithine deacetylase/succinyl-diaminopimelate desuccinylase-like protein